MRLLFALLTSALLTATLPGCKSETVAPNPDYLVFGWYHGECQGEGCIEIFRLDNAARTLAEDTTDHYPSATAAYDGGYKRQSAARYQQGQALTRRVPAQLLTQPVGVVGQPDAADGGGYYVELLDHGQRKFWLIDTQKRNIPTYLYPFIDELDARIRGLR